MTHDPGVINIREVEISMYPLKWEGYISGAEYFITRIYQHKIISRYSLYRDLFLPPKPVSLK